MAIERTLGQANLEEEMHFALSGYARDAAGTLGGNVTTDVTEGRFKQKQ